MYRHVTTKQKGSRSRVNSRCSKLRPRQVAENRTVWTSSGNNIGADLCLKYYRASRYLVRCVMIVPAERKCTGCTNKWSSLSEENVYLQRLNGGYMCVLFVLVQNCECVACVGTKLCLFRLLPLFRWLPHAFSGCITTFLLLWTLISPQWKSGSKDQNRFLPEIFSYRPYSYGFSPVCIITCFRASFAVNGKIRSLPIPILYFEGWVNVCCQFWFVS